MQPFREFLREHLPEPPAHVLEVGCGQGELATALAVDGYDVLGIDPAAPHGDLFRRITLDDVEEEERFDAVVAAHVLHHIRDLDGAVAKIARLLRPGGVLVVDEFGWDLLDETTLDWFYGQRRALAAAGHGEAPASAEELRREWEAHHVGVHPFRTLRAAFAAHFDELDFASAPHLFRKLAGVSTEVLEEALVEAGAIRPLGFRFAGVVRLR